MFHDTEEWCKIWRKTGTLFQIWQDKFSEFPTNHSKVQKIHFDRLFLSNVYEVWAKKIQRSYLSWQWTVMQSLNKPDFVVSKIAWGIDWTFIRVLKSLKNCTLMISICQKHIMFQLENFIGIMCHDIEG